MLEQLDLIETRLADIADALDRNDVDRLLVHGRFLEARFGTARGGLARAAVTPPRGVVFETPGCSVLPDGPVVRFGP